MKWKPLLFAVMIVSLVSCGSRKTEMEFNLIGVDASGSAHEYQLPFERYVRNINESLPTEARLEIFRFDTIASEVHVGHPLDEKEFRVVIEKALTPQKSGLGTSILSLVETFDDRIAANKPAKAHITILTDCGVEDMTAADHEAVKKIVSKWNLDGSVSSVTIAGIRPLMREPLRKDFASLGDKLEIRGDISS